MEVVNSRGFICETNAIKYNLKVDQIKITCDTSTHDLLHFQLREDILHLESECRQSTSATKGLQHKCVLTKTFPHLWKAIASPIDTQRIKAISKIKIDWTKYEQEEKKDPNAKVIRIDPRTGQRSMKDDDEDDDDDDDEGKKNKLASLFSSSITNIQTLQQYNELLLKHQHLVIWSQLPFCKYCNRYEIDKINDIATTLESMKNQTIAIDLPLEQPFYPNVLVVRIDPTFGETRSLARELNLNQCNEQCYIHVVAHSVHKEQEKVALQKRSVIEIVREVSRYASPIVTKKETLIIPNIMEQFGGHVLYGYGTEISKRFQLICSLLHRNGNGGTGMRNGNIETTVRPIGCIQFLNKPSNQLNNLHEENGGITLLVRIKDEYDTPRQVPIQNSLALFELLKTSSGNEDTEENDVQTLHEWIMRSTKPIMQELNFKNGQELQKLNLPVVVIVIDNLNKTKEEMATEARTLTSKVSEKYPTQIACVFQTKEALRYRLKEYGFYTPVKTDSFPLLIVSEIVNKKGNHYSLKEVPSLTKEIVLKHVDAYFSKQLKITRKTQLTAPNWKPGNVRALVYDTLMRDFAAHDEVLFVLSKSFHKNQKKLQHLLTRTAKAIKFALVGDNDEDGSGNGNKIAVGLYDTELNYYNENMLPLLKTTPVHPGHSTAEFIYVKKNPPSMTLFTRSFKSKKKRKIPLQKELNVFIKKNSAIMLENQNEINSNGDVIDTKTIFQKYTMSVNNRIKTEKEEAKQLQQEQMKNDQIHQQEFELQLAERGISWKNKILIKCNTKKKNGMTSSIIKYTNPSFVATAAAAKDGKPKKGDRVKIFYLGETSDGTVVDESDYKGLDFVVGESQVIQCWDRGVLEMVQGEKAWFHCPSNCAWGVNGFGKIGKNEVVNYEISLSSIERK